MNIYEKYKKSRSKANEKWKAKKRTVELPNNDTANVPEDLNAVHSLSLWDWGNKFFSDMFPLEPSPYHRTFVGTLEETILRGGNFAFCFPRGSAKTTWIRIACAWCMCEAIRKFIVFIGGNATEAHKNLAKIKTMFESNDLLLKYYPEICVPIRSIKGVAQRARMMQNQTGESIAFQWKKEIITMPAVPELKSAGYIILALGIDGHIRGLNETLPNGESIRPDLVFLDDPQTREDAKSPKTIINILDIVNGDVLGLAGPGREIAALVAGTIITRGDVMDILTDRKQNPAWHGVRVSMLEEHADNEILWLDTYAKLRKESQIEGEKIPETANNFYREHRAEMDAGAKVYWPARYLPKSGEISAIQNAYNLLIDKGEKVFQSEYQNDPIPDKITVFELTPEKIMNKLSSLPEMALPEVPSILTVGIDLNRYGLTWCLTASTYKLDSYILAYGVHTLKGQKKIYEGKGNVRSEAEELAFLKTLDDLLKHLAALPFRDTHGNPQRLRRVGVDSGYLYTTVRKFVTANAAVYPFELIATRGRSAAYYRPTGTKILTLGSDWKQERDNLGELTIYNSDLWTESTQTGFFYPVGAPGSVALYGNKPKLHSEFADQIAAQTLAEKLEGKTGMLYKWNVIGRNDFLDALIISRVMASVGGANATNDFVITPQSPPQSPPEQTQKEFSPPSPVSYDPMIY